MKLGMLMPLWACSLRPVRKPSGPRVLSIQYWMRLCRRIILTSARPFRDILSDIMYKKGDLRVEIQEGECKWEDGYCENYNHSHPMDARSNEGDKLLNYVSLPHSCDEWLIGGPEQIRDLIDDLWAALDKLEGR
jgi:hypothetical protein